MNQSLVIDARWYYEGNIKVGDIATFSKLASDRDFYTEKYGMVKGTCSPECCAHCGYAKDGKKRPPCYVFKSYRHTSVIECHSRNTLSVYNDVETAYQQLSDSMNRKKKKPVAGRYDQSGEIISALEYECMGRVAKNCPYLPFYVYTKESEIVVPRLLTGKVPENLTTLISIWHEQNIEAYLKVAHLPNVKAFVYCDKNKDPLNGWGPKEYAKHGIIIDAFCKAYGLDGKMNHNVTCDKCKKCFNRSKKAKVIGCWDH